MKDKEKKTEKTGFRGISLGLANFVMTCIGVIVALLMIHATFLTNENYHLMDEVISESLLSQESTGRMESISSSMSSSALAFVNSGDPSHIYAYVSQRMVLDADFSESGMLSEKRLVEDPNLAEAVGAFNALRETEWTAMRLKAETLSIPLTSFPEKLQRITLAEDYEALDTEGKKEKASALLSAPEYANLKTTLAGSVDASHRYVSELASERTAHASEMLGSVVHQQRILIIILVIIAFLALIMNRMLVLRPINRSVDRLDRREPIPVRGSAEMRHLARVYNDVLQDNQEKTRALSYTASHDALTGVSNRAAFDKVYSQCGSGRVGVLIIDVDQFKHFNDHYGHDVGDRVLVRVAETLRHSFRAEDQICRIGGDEFCIIMMNAGMEQADHVRRTIETINETLAEAGDDLPPISISVGVAFWDRPDPAANILKDADTALLQVKKTRASNCAVYGVDAKGIPE